MKSKLLKKARRDVKLINMLGEAATPKDKGITIKKFNPNGTVSTLRTSKNKIAYINYGNAIIRRREEILDLATELNKKSFLWHVFH